jgi:hypothetical protein
MRVSGKFLSGVLAVRGGQESLDCGFASRCSGAKSSLRMTEARRLTKTLKVTGLK